MGRLEALYQRYRAQVAFLVVYVQEAHPTDGWQVDSNVADGVLLRQHQSYNEREQAATICSLTLHLALPIVVEEMDNAIDEAYGAAPERLYLIGKEGRVAYHGGAGPHFFDLEGWERAIMAVVPTESPESVGAPGLPLSASRVGASTLRFYARKA